MKKKFVFPVLLLSLFFFQTGCSVLSDRPKYSVPAAKTARPLSENYYYLEARHYIKKNNLPKAADALKKGLEKAPDSFLLAQNLAFIYLRTGQNEQAISLIRNLMENNPDNIKILLLYIQLQQNDLEKQQLIKLLNKALALDPDNKETYLRLGKLYMSMEDHENSRAHFKKMVKQFPDYYVAWYYLGEIYLIGKEYKLAREPFLKTIELEPELVEPRFQLIQIYDALNSRDKYQIIENTYKQILELEPGSHKALLGMALNKYKAGNKKGAKKIFMTLGQDFKNDINLPGAAFDEYIVKEDKQDAVIIFSQLLKADPEDSTLNFFAAMAYEGNKKFKKAIPLYLKVKPEHSHYQKAILNVSVLYWESGQKKTAFKYLAEKQDELPKDIDITVFLASFYGQEEMFQKAVKVLEKGLKHSPDNPTLLFRLGITLDQGGDRDQGLETMKKVIELDPENSSALNYLGYSYADMGIHLNYALTLIQKAHSLDPDNGHITDSMGWIHYKLGNFETALKYLQKAVEQTDNEAVVVEHLGDVFTKLDNYKEAIKAYTKALDYAGKDWDDEKIVRIKEKINNLKKKLNEK